jgi:hypothetical protein
MKRLLLDRDKMNHADRTRVAAAAIRALDRIQALPREVQLLALATAFILSCDVADTPAQDAFVASKNLMYDPLTQTGIAPQFQGVKRYLQEEIA